MNDRNAIRGVAVLGMVLSAACGTELTDAEPRSKAEASLAITPIVDWGVASGEAWTRQVRVRYVAISLSEARLLGANPRIPAGGWPLLTEDRVVATDGSSTESTELAIPQSFAEADDLAVFLEVGPSELLEGASVEIVADLELRDHTYVAPQAFVMAGPERQTDSGGDPMTPDPDVDPAMSSQVATPDPDVDPAHDDGLYMGPSEDDDSASSEGVAETPDPDVDPADDGTTGTPDPDVDPAHDDGTKTPDPDVDPARCKDGMWEGDADRASSDCPLTEVPADVAQSGVSTPDPDVDPAHPQTSSGLRVERQATLVLRSGLSADFMLLLDREGRALGLRVPLSRWLDESTVSALVGRARASHRSRIFELHEEEGEGHRPRLHLAPATRPHGR